MRPTQYSTATLIDLFHRHTVASLSEVMAALGTRARRTAFRKLKELPYRTSYSHRGGYYTLEELIDFDQHGLWSFRAVRFSAAGTLLATTAELVSDAPFLVIVIYARRDPNSGGDDFQTYVAPSLWLKRTTGFTSAPRMPCASSSSSAS